MAPGCQQGEPSHHTTGRQLQEDLSFRPQQRNPQQERIISYSSQ